MIAFAACSSASRRPVPIDHIMLGVSNLEAGMREFETLTGIRPTFGGEHPHLGTHNALVSAGPATYIEIIAPRPGATVDADLADLAKLDHLTPIGWAVSSSDIAALRAQLTHAGVGASDPRAGSRATPSGTTLHWTTLGITDPELDSAPFFIHWDDATTHPAKTSPGGCEIVRFEIGEPNAGALQRIERALGASLYAHQAATPSMVLTLRCGSREVTFPH